MLNNLHGQEGTQYHYVFSNNQMQKKTEASVPVKLSVGPGLVGGVLWRCGQLWPGINAENLNFGPLNLLSLFCCPSLKL